MPKITTDTVKIAGTNYEVHIFYSERECGFFIKKGLPVSMIGVVEVDNLMPVNGTKRGYNAPKFETIDKLRTELETLVATYEERIKKKRKVIVFTLGIQKKTMQAIAPELSHDYNAAHRFQSYGDEIGFSFDYDVAYEYEIGEKIKYTKYETRQRILGNGEETFEVGFTVRDDSVVIDWTAENEAFFEKMAESVNSLSKMIFDFFDKDNKELNTLIASLKGGNTMFLLQEKTIDEQTEN